jgi:hypothetical protein
MVLFALTKVYLAEYQFVVLLELDIEMCQLFTVCFRRAFSTLDAFFALGVL